MLRWSFDPAYSTVEFAIRNLWYTVHGRFQTVEGVIVFDGDDVSRSAVEAKIAVASIDTGNKRRDAHLRSKEFFDAESYPNIEFRSVSVRRGKDRDSLDLDGDLTIKGKTSRVALAVNEMDRSRSPRGEEFIYYSATTELDRFAFGIDYGRALIGRKLKVTINVQASSS
ncbi:MAG TPA: YceI family protein [Pyrinomonadaceae bacterium]|nr:YceI family protein [Pyrinomonadaceae bacterium]